MAARPCAHFASGSASCTARQAEPPPGQAPAADSAPECGHAERAPSSPPRLPLPFPRPPCPPAAPQDAPGLLASAEHALRLRRRGWDCVRPPPAWLSGRCPLSPSAGPAAAPSPPAAAGLSSETPRPRAQEPVPVGEALLPGPAVTRADSLPLLPAQAGGWESPRGPGHRRRRDSPGSACSSLFPAQGSILQPWRIRRPSNPRSCPARAHFSSSLVSTDDVAGPGRHLLREPGFSSVGSGGHNRGMNWRLTGRAFICSQFWGLEPRSRCQPGVPFPVPDMPPAVPSQG